jgi:predicted ATPase
MPAGDHLFVISGCSGGGKSTLLCELERRGFSTVPEPGRAIVKEQLCSGGTALPWEDSAAFMELVFARLVAAWEQYADAAGPVFFDRSIVDTVCGPHPAGYTPPERFFEAARTCRFNSRVFIAPPWPEIYVQDAERRHTFEDGVSEYVALVPAYEEYGYTVVHLPKTTVERRADFVVAETLR